MKVTKTKRKQKQTPATKVRTIFLLHLFTQLKLTAPDDAPPVKKRKTEASAEVGDDAEDDAEGADDAEADGDDDAAAKKADKPAAAEEAKDDAEKQETKADHQE